MSSVFFLSQCTDCRRQKTEWGSLETQLAFGCALNSLASSVYITLKLYLRVYCILYRYITILLTLKEVGGSKCPIGQNIDCHFSQNYPRVTNILGFVSNN